MCGCDPTVRAHALTGEDIERLLQFGLLLFQRNAGKLAVVLQPDDAWVPGDIAMLISVQTDRPSACLPRTYALPEALIWFTFVKNGILIVGDDRKNRPDLLFNHDVFKFLPDVPINRRAHVIEPQQELDTHVRALPFSVNCPASGEGETNKTYVCEIYVIRG